MITYKQAATVMVEILVLPAYKFNSAYKLLQIPLKNCPLTNSNKLYKVNYIVLSENWLAFSKATKMYFFFYVKLIIKLTYCSRHVCRRANTFWARI